MYAIMRHKKLKMSDLKHAAAHNLRTRNTPNADPNLQHENMVLRGTGDCKIDTQNVLDRAGVNATPKRVAAVEYVMTASPEFFEGMSKEEILSWAQHSIKHLDDKFKKVTVVSATLHMDEATPHLHVYHVPLTSFKGVNTVEDGKRKRIYKDSGKLRLNADYYYGGSKAKCVKEQDEYHAHMQSKYKNLERGKSHVETKATHKDIQDWYSELKEIYEKTDAELRADLNETSEKRGILDTDKKRSERLIIFAERLIESIQALKFENKLVKDKNEELLSTEKDKILNENSELYDSVRRLTDEKEHIKAKQEETGNKYAEEYYKNKELQKEINITKSQHKNELEAKDRENTNVIQSEKALIQLCNAVEKELPAEYYDIYYNTFGKNHPNYKEQNRNSYIQTSNKNRGLSM